MARWIKIVGAFALGVLLVVTVRRTWLMDRAPQEPILLSYEVPPEIAPEVTDVLRAALSPVGKEANGIGRATAAPGGRIIVTATPDVQAGVSAIIKDIKSRKLPPTPTIAYDVWIVSGTPGAAPPAAADVPEELRPVMESIRKTRGGLKFGLLEHLSTSARPGREGSQVAGATAQISLESRLQNGEDGKPRVATKIDIVGYAKFVPGRPEAQPFALKSQFTQVPGELLVIGQSLTRRPGDDPLREEVYFVVRATL